MSIKQKNNVPGCTSEWQIMWQVISVTTNCVCVISDDSEHTTRHICFQGWEPCWNQETGTCSLIARDLHLIAENGALPNLWGLHVAGDFMIIQWSMGMLCYGVTIKGIILFFFISLNIMQHVNPSVSLNYDLLCLNQ